MTQRRTPKAGDPLADFPAERVSAWLKGKYDNNHAEWFAGQELAAWCERHGVELDVPAVAADEEEADDSDLADGSEADEPLGIDGPTGTVVDGLIGDGQAEERALPS